MTLTPHPGGGMITDDPSRGGAVGGSGQKEKKDLEVH